MQPATSENRRCARDARAVFCNSFGVMSWRNDGCTHHPLLLNKNRRTKEVAAWLPLTPPHSPLWRVLFGWNLAEQSPWFQKTHQSTNSSACFPQHTPDGGNVIWYGLSCGCSLWPYKFQAYGWKDGKETRDKMSHPFWFIDEDNDPGE